MAHPLHPALVHFPVACWSLSTIGDLASLAARDDRVWLVSGVLLVLGLATALAAMTAGVYELTKIEDESPAIEIANWHMYLVVGAWVLYGGALYLRLDGTKLTPPDYIAIGLSVSGFVLLSVAGWLGGTLVYGYGIGGKAENDQNK